MKSIAATILFSMFATGCATTDDDGGSRNVEELTRKFNPGSYLPPRSKADAEFEKGMQRSMGIQWRAW